MGKVFKPSGRTSWRKWLEKNHATESMVWLTLRKKSSTQKGVLYDEAVEEALCFGWIDSTTHAIDENFYEQLFTPRKPGSVWSASNKKRVEKLMAEQLMHPAGLAIIELARKSGSWSTIDLSEAWEMPPDLLKAMKKNKTAAANFKTFPPSVQKMTFQWILMAKRPETREKRVQETIEKSAKNIRPR
jgi:uncharacterized protein YdeI (YjbR/CyaY-like superfamily)